MSNQQLVSGEAIPTGLEQVLDRFAELTEPSDIDLADGPDALVLPKGLAIHDLKPLRDARAERPERRTGTAKHTTLESFIRHVNRFADEHTAIFAIDDMKAPKLLAVFDYHEKSAKGLPRFGKHRAEYAYPVSPEWTAWHTIAKSEAISQAQFAEWLEDRITDVLDPSGVGLKTAELIKSIGIELADPATLLTLSRNLTVRVDQRVTQAQSLSSGETQLVYEETHRGTDGNLLKVPGGFAIAIPIFRGGAPYQLPVRLRYRAHGGSVTWRLIIHRSELAFENAFNESLAQLRKDLEHPIDIFAGTPEGG